MSAGKKIWLKIAGYSILVTLAVLGMDWVEMVEGLSVPFG